MPISKVSKSLYQIEFVKIDDVVNTCKYLASWKRSLGKATNRLWAILRWSSEWRLPRALSSITLRLFEARLSHSNFFNWPKALGRKDIFLCWYKKSYLKWQFFKGGLVEETSHHTVNLSHCTVFIFFWKESLSVFVLEHSDFKTKHLRSALVKLLVPH